MSISERRDLENRCRADILSARNGLKSDVASIRTRLTTYGTVIATAATLRAEDPDCTLSAAEVAEWQQLVTDAQAAMGQYAAMIDGLLGG